MLSESFSFGWSMMVLLVLVCSIWLGLFAYKHVAFSSELWWHFALRGDAPRFLRASVGATVLLLIFAVAKLLRPAAQGPDLPGPEELAGAKLILSQSPATLPNLAGGQGAVLR